MGTGGYTNHHGLLLLLSLCSCSLVAIANVGCGANWLNHGKDLTNRRFANEEEKISPVTVSQLQLKWKFVAGKDITATPAIYDGILYFPSWNGNLYAVDAESGSLVWKKNLGELTGLNATGLVANVNWTVSRSTPTVVGPILIVGIYGPAVVIAVDRATGNLVWSTRLDSHAAAVITMSGIVFGRGFYVGVSSLEEGSAVEQCCTFQGSMARLGVETGAIQWQTFMLPDNGGQIGGYSGAAVWGSSPSIDLDRGLVYIGTGNLYTAPPDVIECEEIQSNKTVRDYPDPCVEPENHENSIIALDMDTGEMRWYKQLGGFDAWILACSVTGTPNCPSVPNPDADFGEAPMLLTIVANETTRYVVAAVQKNGFAWALDRDHGGIVWSAVAGPGGSFGGGTWGASTDGIRVYTNIVNNNRLNFTLTPSGQVTNAGAWVAMDANTGRVLWSTANPKNALNNGPVTTANGVLFAGSTDASGPIYAMDAKTGTILWSYDTGATVYGGLSVSDGCIYVGSGYAVNIGASVPSWTAGTSLFAFCV
ncbi:hypothetical protein AAC387_Pa05g2880 [Persea americana]